jgi:hypothetical protein
VDGAIVASAPKVKILGVILDQDLHFKLYIGKAVSKGTKAVLVWVTTTYSSLAVPFDRRVGLCSVMRKDAIIASGIRWPFDAIQRVSTQAIAGVFRTVALAIAKAEAEIQPTIV